MVQAKEFDIGSILKKERKRKKLTQREVADKANMSRNYLSDIENNRYMPSVKTLINLANILKFDLNIICSTTEIQDAKERGA